MEYTEKCGIYKITCLENNKIYIGSSKNIKERLKQHIKLLKSNTHPNQYLQSSFNKFEIKNFKFDIVENHLTYDIKFLIEREDFWMEYYNSMNDNFGFNLKSANQTIISERTKLKISKTLKGRFSGNENPNFGKKFSQERKKEMSDVRKGKFVKELNPFWKKKHSKETKDKISDKNKGRHAGEKNYFFGKKHSEEERKNISERNRKYTNLYIKNIDTGIILKFETNKHIQNYLKCSTSSIDRFIKKQARSLKGYEIISFDFKTKEGIKHIEYAKNLKEMTLDK